MNDASEPDTEEGLTLVEIVVGMVIFSLLTTMVFNLFTTAMGASKNAAQPVNESIATQPAMSALGEAVRNSPDMQPTEDGNALFVLNQEGEYTIWRITNEGFTNGIRTFKDVREAEFEEVDGLITGSITTADGYTVLVSVASRFPKTESVFTETFMASKAPVN